jgi:hypothetical protein
MPDATYDIFSGQMSNAAMWLEAVEGLGNAYQRMTELAANSPGCYFIFCTRTHTVRGFINTVNRKNGQTRPSHRWRDCTPTALPQSSTGNFPARSLALQSHPLERLYVRHSNARREATRYLLQILWQARAPVAFPPRAKRIGRPPGSAVQSLSAALQEVPLRIHLLCKSDCRSLASALRIPLTAPIQSFPDSASL